MKSGMTIEDLLTEVQRQSHAKKDYVASTQHDVRMVPMAGFPSDVAVVLQKGQASDVAENYPVTGLPCLERLEIT